MDMRNINSALAGMCAADEENLIKKVEREKEIRKELFSVQTIIELRAQNQLLAEQNKK